MSSQTIRDDVEEMRDHITWHQILVGYGLVLIMLLLSVMHQLGFSENPHELRDIGAIVIVAVVFTATVLERTVKAFHRNVLTVRPALEDTLQWLAIITLVLLSAATIVHGIYFLPESGWS